MLPPLPVLPPLLVHPPLLLLPLLMHPPLLPTPRMLVLILWQPLGGLLLQLLPTLPSDPPPLPLLAPLLMLTLTPTLTLQCWSSVGCQEEC